MKKIFITFLLVNLNLIANNINDLLNQAIKSSDFETTSNIFKNNEFSEKEKLMFLELANEVHNRIHMNPSLNTINILDWVNKQKYTLATLYLIRKSLFLLEATYSDFIIRCEMQERHNLRSPKSNIIDLRRTLYADQISAEIPSIKTTKLQYISLFDINKITYTLGFLTFTAIIFKKALNVYKDNKESFEKASENSTKIKQLITLSLNDSDSKS